MPKVRFSFDISGRVTQTANVPQSVLDEYNRQVDGGDPDCEALDRLLQPFVRYDDVLDQLDDAEDIELTELKEAASADAE